jgi:hypothetical protein
VCLSTRKRGEKRREIGELEKVDESEREKQKINKKEEEEEEKGL